MRYFASILALLVFFSCNYSGNEAAPQNASYESDIDMEESRADQQVAPEQADAPNVQQVDKSQKIIKDGNVEIEVTDLEQAKAHVDTILGRYKAYYENETFHSGSYQAVYNLKIRLPADYFEALLAGIEQGGGKITQKNIAARDVTEEYIDLSTRLTNKRAYLKRYNELLQKASKIQDILEIQEKTRVIESEIESTEGRLRYLTDQVEFSTLNLTLLQRREYVAKHERNFGRQLVRAFRSGAEGFLDFLVMLVHLWPFLLLLIALLWGFRRWRLKRKIK